MKRILTTSSSGACQLAAAPEFTPPLGLVIPANQTVKAVIPSARTLATLFGGCSPEIPDGFGIQVYEGDIYARDGGSWINEVTSANADSASISGAIFLTNIASYDIGITW
jgi:hypothetical protein